MYEPINGQGREPYRYIPYGKSTVGRVGCEAIAVYNTMSLLGRSTSFDEVKAFFEALFRKGLGWGCRGHLGATPVEMRKFFRSRNICFEGTFSLKKLKRHTEEGIFILHYWVKPYRRGIHTVAVRHDGNGCYTVYNWFNNAETAYLRHDLSDFLPGKRRFIYGMFVPVQ